MPSSPEYLRKARDNYILATSLSRERPIQRTWALVVAFYSALHYVNAYCCKFHKTFSDHVTRNAEVARNPVYESVRDHWDTLLAFGWNARYTCNTYTVAEYDECLDALNQFRTELEILIER